MATSLPNALTGSGPVAGLLRAALSVVVLVGAAVLALFALLLTWTVTLGVAITVLLRTALARRPTGTSAGRDAQASADTEDAPADAEATARELESFHGSLDEFMRDRESRRG